MAVTRHEAWGSAREPDGGNAGTPRVGQQDSLRSKYGSVAKFGFSSKIEKLGTINSMSYRIPNSLKTNFATEPQKDRDGDH